MKTYYTIYKVTNKIDGKIYKGSHKTKNLNDGYIGSGKYLLRAIAKYGIENFHKEILHIFDTSEEMYTKEAELVDESFVKRTNTYNLKVGGFGGFDYINSQGLNLYGKNRENALKVLPKAHQSSIRKIKQNPEWFSQQVKEGLQLAFPNGRINPFKGKNHTKEAKAKIGAANAIYQKGKKNSQYGTCWIHNNRVSKKIEKDDLNEHLIEGWIKGRKIKF